MPIIIAKSCLLAWEISKEGFQVLQKIPAATKYLRCRGKTKTLENKEIISRR